MTNQNITLTDKILAEMLTENTGRAMMDSGDAYGRNWERNQGRDVQSFIDAPEVNVTEWGIELDLFHYLRNRLEFAPDVQEHFDAFCDRKDDDWYSLMEQWCNDIYRSPEHMGDGFNSYNGDCLLSQTIQGNFFEWSDGETYLLLQIHGGADVRGGYTAPKVFSIGYEPYIIYDWNSYVVQSADDRKGEQVCLEFREGDVHDLMGGDYVGYAYGKKSEDANPLLKWFGDLEWDEETNSFIAPDGDGRVEFVAPESS